MSLFQRRQEQEELLREEQAIQEGEASLEGLVETEEYEMVEREILPAKIICPDCGGVTLEGLDFCDKCGGEL